MNEIEEDEIRMQMALEAMEEDSNNGVTLQEHASGVLEKLELLRLHGLIGD